MSLNEESHVPGFFFQDFQRHAHFDLNTDYHTPQTRVVTVQGRQYEVRLEKHLGEYIDITVIPVLTPEEQEMVEVTILHQDIRDMKSITGLPASQFIALISIFLLNLFPIKKLPQHL
ncbi:MAG: hypothetical protein R3A11_04775 [Bdellovibrionota bacterium]